MTSLKAKSKPAAKKLSPKKKAAKAAAPAPATDIADEVFDAIQNRLEYDWHEVEQPVKEGRPS